MENTTVEKLSKVDWKEVGITAGIVLVGGFIACLGAHFAYDGIKAHLAKSASQKKEKEESKK
jgi:hypothetical protein